jgi:hypothetical protein
VKVLTVLVMLACATSASAQQALPSNFAVDTAAALDESIDFDGNYSTGVVVDAVVSAEFGHGFQGIVRPFLQRLNSGEWNRQIWIATLRYERPGPLGLRIDGGLIPSPIGLANLTLRPQNNPTINQPSSLFTPLPPFEPRGSRATLLGAVYAFGAQATVSGTHWDARTALIDTSPLRTRRVFSPTNPPRFYNVVIGGGVTPVVGLRIGASLTHGGWQRAGESPLVTADRDATIATVESELSFRYTKLTGEWTRDRLETSTGPRIASGWFVQGQQTLAPRWFVAGRVERMTSPAVFWVDPGAPPLVVQQRLKGVEETLGYRLTPEITIRVGHRARQGFGRPGFDHTMAVSAVWWRRWL